jgi:IS30 family transposase
MAHKELNLRERRVIEDMLNAKISVRGIAAEIGRHVSTVYRDIKRNG